jgi:hypothetical protein
MAASLTGFTRFTRFTGFTGFTGFAGLECRAALRRAAVPVPFVGLFVGVVVGNQPTG